MNFDDLRYFLTAASTGTLRMAAQELHITQPALTHAIRRLESALGIPLFHRQSRGVVLTEAGVRLRERTQTLFSNIEDLKSYVREEKDQVRGSVKLGCHPAVAHYALPQIFPILAKAFPDIQIELHHDLSRRLNRDIVEGRIDLGVIINPVPLAQLVIRKIGKDEVGLWTRKSSPQDTLIYDPNLAQSQSVLRQLQKRKLNFRRHVTSSDLGVILDLVRAGSGVGLLPGRMVEGEGLLRIHKDSASFQDEIALVFRKEARSRKACRALIDIISQNFK